MFINSNFSSHESSKKSCSWNIDRSSVRVRVTLMFQVGSWIREGEGLGV